MDEIPKYLKKYFTNDSLMHYYTEYGKSAGIVRNIENKFFCLKGFASSTPIYNSIAFGEESHGGGFYFRYHGKGIVVDPGINFVTLMHQNNIFIEDVDVVIVTHHHIDHYIDVHQLTALLYEYNKKDEKEEKFYKNYFGYAPPEKHIIHWIVDEQTKKSILEDVPSEYLHSLSNYTDGEVFSVACSKLDTSIEISSFHTQHIFRQNMCCYSDDTFGVKLSFLCNDKKMIWGYTSDTQYFENLPDALHGCNVILMNISDIYVADVAMQKKKRSHLGFCGCVKLIQEVKPSVVLISEFCCTNGDYRHMIIRAIRERIHKTDSLNNSLVLPADLNLCISIDASKMKCSICGKEFPVIDTKFARPGNGFQNIQYYCPECVL